MPMKIADQRKLAKMLSSKDKMTIARHCNGDMSGKGFMDVMKKVGNFVSPIVRELGPTVLKEVILPIVKNKLSGNGIRVGGSGLKLAGKHGPKGYGKRVGKKTLTLA